MGLATTTTEGPLSSNWVMSTSSNAHLSSDRRWFTTYTPFKSFGCSHYPWLTKLPVVGLGTVLLPVKLSPTRSGPDAHGKLELQDVLHCPTATCNVVGLPASAHNWRISCGDPTGRTKGKITDRQGKNLAYFDPKRKNTEIKLSGPPVGPVVGPSVLDDPNMCSIINVLWDPSEQARWHRYKRLYVQPTLNAKSTETVLKGNAAERSRASAPYTKKEKQWLRRHFRSEWRFLGLYGMTIYKKEDRKKGRAVLRRVMAGELPIRREGLDKCGSDSDDPQSVESEDDEEDEDENESDTDSDGGTSDDSFDEDCLAWLEKHYSYLVINQLSV
ncbi:uncharacterized protein EI97DRAFT_501528 [Westerdykella ornata]|uniref:Uncharacterized protein n=1 Tax=Westerdykella ornata TaxID=318751 RepID=A0A6A6JIL6_WESOR|nr:uncharacterized protein EI97DRAFT_501528 [Westerdykella ornata]KAF2276277.1 hypothetical protein EI97DRAFT_501528 [Westerdykella ornata]